MKSENLQNASKEEVLTVLKETEKHLLNATRNLAHPAYGHSQITTEEIDDLRNELFDFLEIPKS